MNFTRITKKINIFSHPLLPCSSFPSPQVKDHPFFKGINWDKLITDKASITPLFIPNITSAEDTLYFDDEKKRSFGRMTFMDGPDGDGDLNDVIFFVFFLFVCFVC